MATIQQVIDLARVPLNDDDKTRYPDTELLKHCNAALLSLFDRRPDVLVGSYSDTNVIPNGTRVAGDTFPFHAKYIQPVADLIGALAQTKDEEHMDSGRVAALLERYVAFAG